MKFKIISDLDEVLCNITPRWKQRLLQNPKIIDHLKSINHYDVILNSDVLDREQYMLPDWLKLHGNDELFDICSDIYFNDSKFYDFLLPSNYLKSLHQIEGVLESLTIISHIGNDESLPVNLSKKKWLVKYLKYFSIKTEFYLISSDKLKSECINENNLIYHSFVDDSPHVIRDVITNTRSSHKEFLMPLYGYNKNMPDVPYWSMRYNINFKYFDNK